MIIEILMPALSPTMTDGNLTKWYKKEGDKVKAGEIIAEIETDKATMEVEAVDEGIIAKILVSEATNAVLVGEAIALVAEDEADLQNLPSYEIKGKNSALSATAPQENKANLQSLTDTQQHDAKSSGERVFASPLAKRIAEQNSINVACIDGTGPHGRVIKSDVIDFLSSSIPVAPKNSPKGGYDLETVSNMRKVIAKRLLESKQTVPHFYLNIDCNLDKLMLIRDQVNHDREKGEKISVNDFIIRASSIAIAKVPEINSSWTDSGLMKYRDIDISVAVAIDGGLVTPIIKCANLKTISEISAEMKGLARKAKDGKLKPEEYQGGGFSISNLGMFGIKQFNAIINPPQSCILAVGAGIRKPVVIHDQICASTVAELTLSCDHRVVDGAVAAKFFSILKELIENPIKILV